jgi:SNF2 family DNA or RNA helicase
VLVSNDNEVQLQVKRNLKQEMENEQILLNEIQTLESLSDNDSLLSFNDPTDSLNLLDILAKWQEICVVEWPEGEKYKLRGTANINNLNISIKSEINWFDLQGELRVDENTVLTLQQLLRLTEKSHTRFIELSQGEFLALSDRLKKQLDSLRWFTQDDRKGIYLNKFASVGLGDFFDEIENLKTDKLWKNFQQQIEKTKVENALVPISLKAELRAYQEDGFRWMARLAEWNAGACLADDMGLGKTIQTLAILIHRLQHGAALVVCPVSVVNNWVSEAEKFAPTLRFKTLGVSTSNRKEIIQQLEAGNVLVTSYGLLLSEEKLFAEIEWATIVLD